MTTAVVRPLTRAFGEAANFVLVSVFVVDDRFYAHVLRGKFEGIATPDRFSVRMSKKVAPLDLGQRTAEANLTAKGCRINQPDADELDNSAVNIRTIFQRLVLSAVHSHYINTFFFAPFRVLGMRLTSRSTFSP